jgi:hypothetical protein
MKARVETRRTFLKKAATGGALGAASVGGLTRSGTAQASAILDASFNSPYAPYPIIAYPSSWHVYTALIPGVIEPFDVVLSNRQLGALPDIDGLPDMRAVPSDATMLVLFSEQLPVDYDVSRAIPFRETMRFNDLGGGVVDHTPGGARRFQGWWSARVSGNVYGFNLFVFVGRSAGSEWRDVQAIVDSIRLPS